MTTERQFQEIVARCVAIMVSYHNTSRTLSTTAQMIAEVHALARDVMTLGHRAEEIIERILQPTESELLARYSHEAGSRINTAFLEAFEEEAVLRISPRGHGC